MARRLTLKEVFLKESEVYVDEHGMAHDDEGNKWPVGMSYAGGTYRAGELPQPRRQRSRQRRRPVSGVKIQQEPDKKQTEFEF